MSDTSGDAENGKTGTELKKRKPRSASKYVGMVGVHGSGPNDPAKEWEVKYFGKTSKDIKAQVKDENEIVWIVRDHDKFQAIVQKIFTFEKIK